jgi:primosomal protein N' (replication factor Y)
MGFYIDVILPVPIDQLFSYEVTKTEFSFIKSGCRVAVPFGKSRIITGMVCNIHQVAPISYDVKSIHQIIDESPVVNDNQLQFWAWMSQYYMCSIGDVMKASIPSVLLFESETIVTLNKTIEIDQNILSDDEFLIYEALLDVKELTISEVSNILNKKNVFKFIQSLNEKHILEIDEKLYSKYKPKLKRHVELNSVYSNDNVYQDTKEVLKKSPKQLELFIQLIDLN